MLISQILDPADLVSLTDRQVTILNSIAVAEIASSSVIKKELNAKLNVALKALKRPTDQQGPN